MVAKRLRFGLGFFYLCLSSVTVLEAADSPAGDELKPACCRYEGAEVAQLHKSADRLYSQFKPKDAVVELVKILRADSNKFEALVKLARAHIDIDDLVPENGADWHERKLKDYTTAQDYARKALQVVPNSTWSHFWIAAAARALLKAIPEMPVQCSDDAKHKQNAAQLLDEIKDR